MAVFCIINFSRSGGFSHRRQNINERHSPSLTPYGKPLGWIRSGFIPRRHLRYMDEDNIRLYLFSQGNHVVIMLSYSGIIYISGVFCQKRRSNAEKTNGSFQHRRDDDCHNDDINNPDQRTDGCISGRFCHVCHLLHHLIQAAISHRHRIPGKREVGRCP